MWIATWLRIVYVTYHPFALKFYEKQNVNKLSHFAELKNVFFYHKKSLLFNNE
jgi:hypothetical protein